MKTPDFTEGEYAVIAALKVLISIDHLLKVDTAASGIDYDTYAREILDILVPLSIAATGGVAAAAGVDLDRLKELTAHVQEGFTQCLSSQETRH